MRYSSEVVEPYMTFLRVNVDVSLSFSIPGNAEILSECLRNIISQLAGKLDLTTLKSFHITTNVRAALSAHKIPDKYQSGIRDAEIVSVRRRDHMGAWGTHVVANINDMRSLSDPTDPDYSRCVDAVSHALAHVHSNAAIERCCGNVPDAVWHELALDFVLEHHARFLMPQHAPDSLWWKMERFTYEMDDTGAFMELDRYEPLPFNGDQIHVTKADQQLFRFAASLLGELATKEGVTNYEGLSIPPLAPHTVEWLKRLEKSLLPFERGLENKTITSLDFEKVRAGLLGYYKARDGVEIPPWDLRGVDEPQDHISCRVAFSYLN